MSGVRDHMSYFIVYLLRNGSTHVRNYRDKDFDKMNREFPLIQSAVNVLAVTKVDGAHDTLRARVQATKEWLEDGTITAEGSI